jgi:hypothetical protein
VRRAAQVWSRVPKHKRKLLHNLDPDRIFVFQAFELAFAIILVAGVFAMSGSQTAVAAMVVSLLMATAGQYRALEPVIHSRADIGQVLFTAFDEKAL